jgi:hypothetical protein
MLDRRRAGSRYGRKAEAPGDLLEDVPFLAAFVVVIAGCGGSGSAEYEAAPGIGMTPADTQC